MITLISTIFGVLSSLLPNIIKIFEKKQDYAHEIALTKLKMDAAKEGLLFQLEMEEVKASVAEGESVRKHDNDIEYTGFWAALRASIRPTITYAFFALFVGIKIAAFWVLVERGASPTELLTLVWDSETMAIFSAIIGFWFGSRAIEKFSTVPFTTSLFSPHTIPTAPATQVAAAVGVSKPAKKTVVKKRLIGTGRDK
jgi:hypothetical protein